MKQQPSENKGKLYSIEQGRQASANRRINGQRQMGTIDNKKLNGPNRPST